MQRNLDRACRIWTAAQAGLWCSLGAIPSRWLILGLILVPGWTSGTAEGIPEIFPSFAHICWPGPRTRRNRKCQTPPASSLVPSTRCLCIHGSRRLTAFTVWRQGPGESRTHLPTALHQNSYSFRFLLYLNPNNSVWFYVSQDCPPVFATTKKVIPVTFTFSFFITKMRIIRVQTQ